MSIAFVLSGGGSLGSVQVGMLHALYERDIVPDFFVATSVGAVNAAFVATRPPTMETVRELEDVWRGVRRGDVFPADLLAGFLGFTGWRRALVPSSELKRLIARNTRASRLEETSTPLHVIAVDVLSGTERRLSEGTLLDAVLASTAIPAVFEPVAWHGEELVDGGVANNTPISHAIELGARTVYVLPTGYACALAAPPRTALGSGLHALTLLIQQRLLFDIATLRTRVRLVVLPPPCPLDVSPADFSRSAELIERARRDARSFLDRIDRAGSAVPDMMLAMHRH